MHVGAFRAAGAHVVALCGLDLASTREIARHENVELATDDLGTLCREVELVVVASPDAWHATHVEAALRAGRHVMCEKPLSRTLEEARTMRALADASGRRCAVNFPYRQLPPLVALRAWLPRVRHLEVNLRSSFVGPTDLSADFGGMSHVIDAALWLCRGTPESVLAAFDGSAVSLKLSLRGGCFVNFVHRATVEPGIHGAWSLAGDGFEAGFFAGYLPTIGGWRIGAPRACLGGAWHDVGPSAEPEPGKIEPWAEAHVTAARAFLSGELERLASFREGLEVQAVLAAARHASVSGRRELVML
jgi:predicted dehydrogenase